MSDSPRWTWRRVLLLVVIIPVAIVAGLLAEHLTLCLWDTVEDAIEARKATPTEQPRSE
jgi:hypothetical protein